MSTDQHMFDRRASVDGSYTLRTRAYVKPRGLKPRVRKLLIVLRLLSLGRHRRRSSCSSVARMSARKLADPLTEAEAAFLGKVLSFVPVMARTSKLMRPFLDEADNSLHELAARTLHQAKVMTIRTVWKDLMEPLKEEIDKSKQRHNTLQDQFRESRTEFLREIATLRDEARVRGDPEKCLGEGQLKDVMFFFEPMKTLQPHELQYCLEVIKEKLKMIFEANAGVSPTVNFGQIERLKELLISSEVAKQKEIITQKSLEIVELERERRHLQRELAVVSKGYRNVNLEAQTASNASESAKAEAAAETDQLRQELQSLKEASELQAAKLKKFAEQARSLHRERDNALKRLKISEEETKDVQQKLGKAEEEVNKQIQELQEAKRELRILENRDMIVNEQIERQRVYGETLIKENETLRKTMGRWQERRRSAPSILDNKLFLEKVLAAESAEQVNSDDPEPSGNSHTESEAETSPLAEEVGDLIEKLRESDEQLQEAIAQQNKMSTYACDLEFENKRLRQVLEDQARYMVQHGADLELQHAEALATVMQRLRGQSQDSKGSEEEDSDSSDGPQLGLPQTLEHEGSNGSTNGINHLHEELLALAKSSGEDEEQEHKDRERLGAQAASAVERMQARLKKLRKLTTNLQTGQGLQGELGSGDEADGPTVSYVKTAKEAAKAAKELQEELDGMCEVTARVAVALKSSVEETAQTREAVALLNDQVKMAEAALKSSPALEGDEHLQRCLQKMRTLGHSALFSEVSGVFGRLWNDSLDRQKRRFLQSERREKIKAAIATPAVYVLDTRSHLDEREQPETAKQTQKPSRPGSALRTLQTEAPDAPDVSAASATSPLASRAPSNDSTRKPDAHRRPSKTNFPGPDLSFPPSISKRRASAPEVVTHSWCLSDRPKRTSQTGATSNTSNLPPPSPTGSALIIRSVSPSSHASPRLDTDDLAVLPHAPLHPKTGPHSPRPQPVKAKPEDLFDEDRAADDPILQARFRPRVVPPLAPIGTQSPSRSPSKPRESRSSAWHSVPNDANGWEPVISSQSGQPRKAF